MYKSYKKPFLKLITFFGKKVFDKKFSQPPIYIGGCGRSGTTLLLSILSSHPEIFACPQELGLYHNMEHDSRGNIYPKRIDRLYRTFFMNKIPDSCSRWCEKSPSNVKFIDDINEYHNGNFKFICIVRDGRDVILSRHPTNPDTYWVDPSRWIADVTSGYEERNNPKVHTVRYEDLVLNYEEEIEKICSFLEIPLCHEILNWHEHTSVKKNRAYFGKVKDIFTDSVGKWKKEQHRERAEALMKHEEAKALLSFYGYEI